MDVDTYIKARRGLIDKKLIAFDNMVFQVLSLPQRQVQHQQQKASTNSKQTEYQAIASIFKQFNNQ